MPELRQMYRACYICKVRVPRTTKLNSPCPISTCDGKIDEYMVTEPPKSVVEHGTAGVSIKDWITHVRSRRSRG